LVRFSGSRTVGGIKITTVPAAHSNGINGAMIGGELGEMLDAAGLTAYAGPPTGYVVIFTNGLSVYLSGGTGITTEQERVVRDHYGVKLAVINIGDTFTTGPRSVKRRDRLRVSTLLINIKRFCLSCGEISVIQVESSTVAIT
ncbi:MAG: hypothetical protein AB2535_09955, partial [Candidatus Thiodiazotropha endolucinida]